MTLDGLEDAYEKGTAMGVYAEQCVRDYHFTRKQLDDYALTSFERAQYASSENLFAHEIAPIIELTKTGEHIIDRDEHPFSVDPERIPTLPPVFAKEGLVTAGNSSSIADGAAALILMTLAQAQQRGIKPLARIVGHYATAKAPQAFSTAPIDATKGLLEKIHWPIETVDLFEVNEAFAAVVLAFMHDLNISHEKVNIYGGACALGHPIGASGARILVTLLSALQQTQRKRGIATLCIGGGEATAIAIEMMD